MLNVSKVKTLGLETQAPNDGYPNLKSNTICKQYCIKEISGTQVMGFGLRISDGRTEGSAVLYLAQQYLTMV